MVFSYVINQILLEMKKTILIVIFFLTLIVNAQENKVQDYGDSCTCLVCSLSFNCADKSECNGRNFAAIEYAYKIKKPKGTHIYSLGTIMNIYPNPVIDFCNLELHEDLFMTGYKVFDLNGNLFLEENMLPTQRYLADFSCLTSGNYIINIQIDEYLNGSNIIAKQFEKE